MYCTVVGEKEHLSACSGCSSKVLLVFPLSLQLIAQVPCRDYTNEKKLIAQVLRRYDMNGRFQMQGGKNWILPKEINANRISGTLIGWKSGQTTYFPLWDRMEGSWLWTLRRDHTIEKNYCAGAVARLHNWTIDWAGAAAILHNWKNWLRWCRGDTIQLKKFIAQVAQQDNMIENNVLLRCCGKNI